MPHVQKKLLKSSDWNFFITKPQPTLHHHHHHFLIYIMRDTSAYYNKATLRFYHNSHLFTVWWKFTCQNQFLPFPPTPKNCRQKTKSFQNTLVHQLNIPHLSFKAKKSQTKKWYFHNEILKSLEILPCIFKHQNYSCKGKCVNKIFIWKLCTCNFSFLSK